MRVVIGAPGREPMLAYRSRRDAPGEPERGFSALGRGLRRIGDPLRGVASTATITHAEFDNVTTAVTTAAIGGPFRGPVAAAERCDPAARRRRCQGLVPVRHRRGCRRRPDRPRRVRRRVHAGQRAVGRPRHGRRRRRPHHDPDGHAGRSSATSHSRAATSPGSAMATATRSSCTISSRRGRAAFDCERPARDLVDELALQPDGTVAISYGDRTGQRLGWAAPGSPASASSTVAWARRPGARRRAGALRARPVRAPVHGRARAAPARGRTGAAAGAVPGAAAARRRPRPRRDPRHLGRPVDAARLRPCARGPGRILVRPL